MAIRNDHDDYDWAVRRNLRQRPLQRDDDYGRPPPRLGDTLTELAMTIAGFVGVILLVYAVLGAFR
jgi:hypothetical protein